MPNVPPKQINKRSTSFAQLSQTKTGVNDSKTQTPQSQEAEKTANNNLKKMATPKEEKTPSPVPVLPKAKKAMKPEKEEKATKQQKKEAMAIIGNVMPVTPAGTINDVHTSYDNIQKLAEMAILDHFQHSPHDFDLDYNTAEIVYPSTIKGYLLWAFFTKLRQVGSLLTTTTNADVNSFPDFPDEGYLPNSFWFAIQYHMPYEEDGSTSQYKLQLASLPVGNDNRIAVANGSTNVLSYPALTAAFISWLKNDNGEHCVNIAASAATVNFSTVALKVAQISAMFQGRGCAKPFGQLSDKAPDASVYAIVDVVTNTVCCHVRKFKPELALALHYTAAGTHDSDLGGCQFKKSYLSNAAWCGSREATITANEWAKSCFTFFANRHDYTKGDTSFVPYWCGVKMKSFIAVQRTCDLRGFWQVVLAFIETGTQDLGVVMDANTCFHFLWIMELALAARVYCNTPAIYGRTCVSSSADYRYDQAAYIGKSACSIRVPPAIASYIDCYGVYLDENKIPCAFWPQWDTLGNNYLTWISIAAQTAAVDYANNGLGGAGLIRPFLKTTAGNVVSVRGVTWNSAYLAQFTTDNVLPPVWPQKNLEVLCKYAYKDILKFVGGSDTFVSVSDKLELAGRCTSAITWAQTVGFDGDSTINSGGGFAYNKQIICLRVGSPTPLVGAELAKAQLFLYAVDHNNDRTLKCKFQKDCEDYQSPKELMNTIIQDTMQLDGSYQAELAKRRASTAKKQFIDVPGAGLIPAPVKDVAMDIMDEAFAKASSFLGDVIGEDATDAIINIGKKALPALSKAGLAVLGDMLAPGLGSFAFA